MTIEQDVLETKAKLKMVELKLQALINILHKEGVILEDEIERELNTIIHEETET